MSRILGKVTWNQEGNKLTLKREDVETFFIMPDFFKLEDVHNDCLKLVEYVLFFPIDKELLKGYEFTRNKGKGLGMAYSGGVDSTAALTLLDKVEGLELFYMQRDGITDCIMRQDNPLHSMMLVEKIRQRPVYCIKTDFEKIRKEKEDKPIGFSSDLAVLVGAILCADYFNFGYLSCGMMMESTYLKRGYEYRDFGKDEYIERWFKPFKKAGLELFFPVIVCSEILTTHITRLGRFYGVSQSCLRSAEGFGCMNCYKCFRKNLLSGRLIPINRETAGVLSQPKIKQGASLIYALNKFNFNVPGLEKYKGWNLDFLEGFYEKGFELMPIECREFLKNELLRYCQPMEYDLSEFKWKE